MTKPEFIKSFKLLMASYGRKFVADYSLPAEHIQTVGETWYTFFSECSDNDFSQTVSKWISKQSAPPTIADLKKAYNSEVHRRKCEAEKERKRREDEESRPSPEDYFKMRV